MTPNQVAEEEDLGFVIPDQNGGDTYVRNTQFVPVDSSVTPVDIPSIKNVPTNSLSENT